MRRIAALALALTLTTGIAGALAGAGGCGPCGGGDPSCFGPTLVIRSPASDLVSATGCGRSAQCNPSPCNELWVLAPVDGGVCMTMVSFADGSTETVTTNWGVVHPHDCCGPTYDFAGGTITVHADASTD